MLSEKSVSIIIGRLKADLPSELKYLGIRKGIQFVGHNIQYHFALL